jgi:O-antigen ligase
MLRELRPIENGGWFGQYLRAPATWRWLVAASLGITMLHISSLGGSVPAPLWYLGQFGPLLLASAAMFSAARPLKLTGISGLQIVLVLLAALSSAWSDYPQRSLSEALLMLLVFAFLVPTSAIRWLDKEVLFGDLKFLYFFIAAAMVAGIVLWIVAPPLAMGYYGRYQGAFPNPNYAAIAAALSIALGTWYSMVESRRAIKLLIVVTLVMSAGTLWLSGSRGALAAAVLGSLVTLGLSAYRRAVVVVMGVLIVAVGVILLARPGILIGNGGFFDRSFQGSDFTSGRLGIWGRMFSLWAGHPVFGIGYRTIEELPASNDLGAHNIYLSVLVELGIIGFVVLVALLARILSVGLRSRMPENRMLLGGAVTVIVIELTEASLFGFGGPTALLSWLILLAFAAAGNREDPVYSLPGQEVDGDRKMSRVELNSESTGADDRISVCMATYNGESFVEEQVKSILRELRPNDELVVIDDGSRDDTVSIVRAIGDDRIRILLNSTNMGHVAAFERSIREATGDLVFLADQDDVWLPGRVELLREALRDKQYAASNWTVLGAESISEDQPRLSANDTDTPWRNVARLYLGSIPYFGCTMAFRRQALSSILPFPPMTEAHDHWIALMGNLDGGIAHVGESTVARRLHENNLTSTRRSLGPVLRTRVKLTVLLVTALVRRR